MIELVNIDTKYGNYLREIDSSVPLLSNEKKVRPFVGVLFELNGIRYYAPLSSPKKKFFNMKNSIDFQKIEEGELGAINFNNMIPVVEGVSFPVYIIKDFDDDDETRKYKILLTKQLDWCRKNQDLIIKKAVKLYELQSCSMNIKLLSRCCNFKLLEERCKEYVSELSNTQKKGFSR